MMAAACSGMHFAAALGSVDCTKIMVEAGADLDLQDILGECHTQSVHSKPFPLNLNAQKSVRSSGLSATLTTHVCLGRIAASSVAERAKKNLGVVRLHQTASNMLHSTHGCACSPTHHKHVAACV